MRAMHFLLKDDWILNDLFKLVAKFYVIMNGVAVKKGFGESVCTDSLGTRMLETGI